MSNNDIRLGIEENVDINTLKTIIEKHILMGNIIFTDSWNGYLFLNDDNSGYMHIQNNHSRSIFGDTSRIEGLWEEIKFQLKRLYSTRREKNFV